MGAFTETCRIVCADAALRVEFRTDRSDAEHRVGIPGLCGGRYPAPFTAQDVCDRRTARGPYEPGRPDGAVAGRPEELAVEERPRSSGCRLGS